jgi:hypothetical protein
MDLQSFLQMTREGLVFFQDDLLTLASVWTPTQHPVEHKAFHGPHSATNGADPPKLCGTDSSLPSQGPVRS